MPSEREFADSAVRSSGHDNTLAPGTWIAAHPHPNVTEKRIGQHIASRQDSALSMEIPKKPKRKTAES